MKHAKNAECIKFQLYTNTAGYGKISVMEGS